MASWQPQEEELREICGLLEQQMSPSSDKSQIWQQLQHYSQFPDFNDYVLARAQDYYMEEANTSPAYNDKIHKEAPQLVTLLKEMKDGLDKVTAKVQDLTAKVKADHFPTADGITYLEAKHLLLLNYCQLLVYYLLCKAKGFSIEGHPVVRSLVEIRLFLEKIRPIDKKYQYQIQKLTRVTGTAEEKPASNEKEAGATNKNEEDLLKYRPNPNMLTKSVAVPEDGGGVYRPPKFAPTSMEGEKTSKQKRNAFRKENEMLRQAQQSEYVKSIIYDIEGRPEEIRENVGAESRELSRYTAKMEERARQEEDLFTRAPLTKLEKKKMKHLEKSRNGLLGLAENFYDDIKSMPLEGSGPRQSLGFESGGRLDKVSKKRKGRH